MTLSGQAFVKEIQQMVRAKHSKNHPIIEMIEKGELTREQLKGFVGQFYLFFPKPFPRIAIRDCLSALRRPAVTAKTNWIVSSRRPKPKPSWTGASCSCTSDLGSNFMPAKAFVWKEPPMNGWRGSLPG